MNEQIKKTKNSLQRKRAIFIIGMLAIPIIQYCIFFIYVNIGSIRMSFQRIDYTNGQTINGTLYYYQKFFSEFTQKEDFILAFRNSFLAAVNNGVLILLSIIFGYLFYKKMPGSGVFRVIFYLPSIISITIYTMVYRYMFESGGPIDSVLKLIGIAEDKIPIWLNDGNWALPLVFIYCIWVGIGYQVLILSGALAKLPEDVMEYAKIDGCGMFRELFQMVIPMIWPTIAVMILGCITTMFTFFLQVTLIFPDATQAKPAQTIAYMINTRVKGKGADPEWAACMGVCFTIMATPLILLVRKFNSWMESKFGF